MHQRTAQILLGGTQLENDHYCIWDFSHRLYNIPKNNCYLILKRSNNFGPKSFQNLKKSISFFIASIENKLVFVVALFVTVRFIDHHFSFFRLTRVRLKLFFFMEPSTAAQQQVGNEMSQGV